MSSAGRYFCAESARERGDCLFATAPRVDHWLLLEHVAPWSAKAFPDDRLSPDVREHVERIAASMPRTRRLMVRQGYQRSEQSRLFLARSGEHGAEAACVMTSCREDLLGLDARAVWTSAWTKPMFLVCTHGKHDKCCARFGFATFRAMRQSAPDLAWECSHVGGDRFAANVIALPEGLYYGHVEPQDAAELMAEHLAGRVSLRHYRGRTCYERPVQAAEYFVRREAGLRGIWDLRLVGSERVEAGTTRVRFEGPQGGYEVVVRSRPSGRRGLMTCGAEKAEGVREFELVERPSASR